MENDIASEVEGQGETPGRVYETVEQLYEDMMGSQTLRFWGKQLANDEKGRKRLTDGPEESYADGRQHKANRYRIAINFYDYSRQDKEGRSLQVDAVALTDENIRSFSLEPLDEYVWRADMAIKYPHIFRRT